MEVRSWLQFTFTYFLALIIESSLAKWTADKCHDAGFSQNLLCGSCDELIRFKLGELEDSCRNCCEADKESVGGQVYHAATLKVCKWKIGRYPQIQAFVHEKKSLFPNVRVSYERGADPQMLLHDENDNVKETLSITKWDTDTVEEFLREKLKRI